MFKRGFDILAAATLLALTLPVIAAAAVLIKLESDGPAIFSQDRMGRRFVRFRLFKLRTMRINRAGKAYTLGDDPRITRIGCWLRRSKIDELPQLWNVLRGDMSLVGPRPVVPELANEFRSAYVQLLAVRPGLTDPASLEYCCENEILSAFGSPADADRYFKQVITPNKIRISLQYMRKRNLWTDLEMVSQTALMLTWPWYRDRVAHRPLLVLKDARPRMASQTLKHCLHAAAIQPSAGTFEERLPRGGVGEAAEERGSPGANQIYS